MPKKQIDRLSFAQGGLCFFCKQPLKKSEASVEHLLASANGGSNSDENCVVCCKAVNALLGSMSLKEKIQVVLNQKGQFKCPNGAGSSKTTSKPTAKPATQSPKSTADDKLSLVVANLKQRGHARPRKLKTLNSTIASLASLFPNGLSEAELDELIQQLQSSGKVTITGNNVTYLL
jgi:hypothetical protein